MHFLRLPSQVTLFHYFICMGGNFQATIGFPDSEISQKAVRLVLSCILSVSAHLSGFKLYLVPPMHLETKTFSLLVPATVEITFVETTLHFLYSTTGDLYTFLTLPQNTAATLHTVFLPYSKKGARTHRLASTGLRTSLSLVHKNSKLSFLLRSTTLFTQFLTVNEIHQLHVRGHLQFYYPVLADQLHFFGGHLRFNFQGK